MKNLCFQQNSYMKYFLVVILSLSSQEIGKIMKTDNFQWRLRRYLISPS